MMIKVMSVFGTRPEAIKMAPLIKALEKDERFESIVTVTGQHREMLDQVLEVFEITPDHDLDVMSVNQTLTAITTKVLLSLEPILQAEQPDIVLVHGDTTTTFAAATAAFYQQIKVRHVEAGLRTWNKWSPFPEEINRQATDVLADLYFAPTNESADNLRREHHDEANIFVTGNTAIDAMRYTIVADQKSDHLSSSSTKQLLVTMHRRENLGEPMANVFQALEGLLKNFLMYPLFFRCIKILKYEN